MEGKIIVNLVINMSDFAVDDNKKITVIDGSFYFQGQKYVIVNKEIYHDQKGVKHEEI